MKNNNQPFGNPTRNWNISYIISFSESRNSLSIHEDDKNPELYDYKIIAKNSEFIADCFWSYWHRMQDKEENTFESAKVLYHNFIAIIDEVSIKYDIYNCVNKSIL